MRAHAVRNVLGAVALALAFGMLVAVGSVTERFHRTSAERADAAPACDDSRGDAVRGSIARRNARSPERALVQIVERGPYGFAYVDALRERAGLRADASAHALARSEPRDVRGMRTAIRYAHVEASGSFRCSRLAPGGYFAIATTLAANGRATVTVAPFTIPLRGDATTVVAPGRFRPLAMVSQ